MILVLALTAGTSISVFGATYADSHPFNSVGTAAYEDFETFSQHDGADYHSVNENDYAPHELIHAQPYFKYTLDTAANTPELSAANSMPESSAPSYEFAYGEYDAHSYKLWSVKISADYANTVSAMKPLHSVMTSASGY